MWKQATAKLNSQLADVAVNNAVESALSAVEFPADKSTSNGQTETAATDDRRQSLISGSVGVISVTPWSAGEYSGNRQDVSFYLTPKSAQQLLVERLAFSAWESAAVFMVMADSAEQLASELEILNSAFPVVEITSALRRANALKTHESEKRFIADDEYSSSDKSAAALPLFDQYQAAAQNISVSEAVASDKSPVNMLQLFINKRKGRLTEMAESLADITAAGGSLKHVMKLTGGNLAQQVRNATPPNEQAPFCVLVAIGGKADVMTDVLKVIN